MAEPVIRPAALADVPAIAAIYGEQVLNGTGTFETDPPEDLEMTARYERVTQSGHPWLVVELDRRVAGFAYAGPFRPRAAYFKTVEDAIYLAPEARGRGVGKLLLTALIAEAERRGYRQMLGIIGDSQNLASVALHRACGFTAIGSFRDVGWKKSRWLDTVLMQRALGPGSATEP